MEEREAEMKIDVKKETEEMKTDKYMKDIVSRKYRKWKQKGKGKLDLLHTTRDLWSLKSSWTIPCRSTCRILLFLAVPCISLLAKYYTQRC